jgi:hypothetical protein
MVDGGIGLLLAPSIGTVRQFMLAGRDGSVTRLPFTGWPQFNNSGRLVHGPFSV